MCAGDTTAFDAFLKLHWTPLIRYATLFLGSVDDAQDIVQEAFVRLWEQRAELRASGSIRAYLYQIARNLAINEQKRRDLHRRLESRETERLLPRLATPAQALDASELEAVVRLAVESLPARRREAFVLAHLDDLPHREIAGIMDIAPQTVANQISAALAELRVALAPHLRALDDGKLRRSG